VAAQAILLVWNAKEDRDAIERWHDACCTIIVIDRRREFAFSRYSFRNSCSSPAWFGGRDASLSREWPVIEASASHRGWRFLASSFRARYMLALFLRLRHSCRLCTVQIAFNYYAPWCACSYIDCLLHLMVRIIINININNIKERADYIVIQENEWMNESVTLSRFLSFISFWLITALECNFSYSQ